MSLPPRRDPRSEPGEVPLEEVLGRGPARGTRSSSPRSRAGEEEPRSETRSLSNDSRDSAEADLLAELTGQLIREERARRDAEARVRQLEEDLATADALRDRAVSEMRAQMEGLRADLRASETRRSEEAFASKLEIERALVEAQAEIAVLKARRSPSVRAMAAASLGAREPQRSENVEEELAAVRRTADEALAALKDLIQRKEAVLAEGRAILERLSPATRAAIGAPDSPRPSSLPTPREGVPVGSSDWPELIFDQDKS